MMSPQLQLRLGRVTKTWRHHRPLFYGLISQANKASVNIPPSSFFITSIVFIDVVCMTLCSMPYVL